jgi:hypothetical protein
MATIRIATVTTTGRTEPAAPTVWQAAHYLLRRSWSDTAGDRATADLLSRPASGPTARAWKYRRDKGATMALEQLKVREIVKQSVSKSMEHQTLQ